MRSGLAIQDEHGRDSNGYQVVTLADRRRKTLPSGGTYGRYLAASGGKGYLTYVSRGTLFAIRFDPKKLQTFVSPIPVLQQVSYSAMFGSAKLSFSRTGLLVYRSRGPIFSQNGKDLFYFDVPDERIMVASYSLKGDAFVAEKPRVWSGQSVALTLSGSVAPSMTLPPTAAESKVVFLRISAVPHRGLCPG